MKNARMNISRFRFILFNLKIFGEIVSTFIFYYWETSGLKIRVLTSYISQFHKFLTISLGATTTISSANISLDANMNVDLKRLLNIFRHKLIEWQLHLFTNMIVFMFVGYLCDQYAFKKNVLLKKV